MNSEIKNLISQRAQLKAKLTKFKTYLDKFEGANNVTELRMRKDRFKPLIDQFELIQSQIEIATEIEMQSDERDLFEDQYFLLLSRAEDVLSVNSNDQASSSILQNSISTHNATNQELQVKLPTLALPAFSGKYEQWISFYETFNSLINESQNLTKVQKFHYLKSCLKDEAASIIESLGISTDNYDTAWELLKMRYENKRIIIKTHVHALFNLPTATKTQAAYMRTLLETATLHIKTLKKLGLSTDTWDVLINYLVLAKLDERTQRDWEQENNKDVPTFEELSSFLRDKCSVLEALEFSKSSKSNSHLDIHKGAVNKNSHGSKYAAHLAVNKPLCVICKQEHNIQRCNKFAEMSGEQRIKEIQTQKLCTNCLKANHTASKCYSSHRCHHCRKRHHSLLHLKENIQIPLENDEQEQRKVAAIANKTHDHKCEQVLLPTAIVQVMNKYGKTLKCRVLLDSGAQSHFITKKLCDELDIEKRTVCVPIIGIANSKTNVKQIANINLKSCYNSFSANIDCLVLDTITTELPIVSIPKSNFIIPKNIKLADGDFNVSSQIQLIIGSELFWSLLCIGQIKGSKSGPIYQKTQLGWIVGGCIPRESNSKLNNKTIKSGSYVSIQNPDSKLEHLVTKYWEVEGLSNTVKIHYTEEELECEKHFINNYRKSRKNQFIVKLPLKPNIEQLGTNEFNARRRFTALERKLNKNPNLKERYTKFIKDYLELGHMELIDSKTFTPKGDKNEKQYVYYLPHHAVVKETSATTKLRVVFDASCPSDTGVTLNDAVMTGPALQQDLFRILIRFRIYKYILSADITKMYRQIVVDSSHRDLQRIFWRDHPSEELKTYRLKTVTYGMACSPFLAIRCLHQIANELAGTFPSIQQVIMKDIYVDDILTGANTISEAINLQKQLTTVLQSYGFRLHKWASNITNLIPEQVHNNEAVNLDKQGETKTLGLYWNWATDSLKYNTKEILIKQKVTKRQVLSHISQLFDPLGLVSPILITAKILLQKIWSLQLHWDESIPTAMHTQWIHFTNQLKEIRNINIQRKGKVDCEKDYEIHGFSDASEQAFGVCVYVRTSNGLTYDVDLLCAKSKVAPLKSTTLPRMELCAALLLAKLINKLSNILNLSLNRCYCWTDSTIVLAWLSDHPSKWQTFVANRVAEVQELTCIENWSHVLSQNNPADLPSRGVTTDQLLNSNLWWHGPQFLATDYQGKYAYKPEQQEIPEQRKTVFVATIKREEYIFDKYSSFSNAQRIMAWCLRFIHNSKIKDDRLQGPLTCAEIKQATTAILKVIQKNAFGTEITDLSHGKTVALRSPLLTLKPFLGKDNLIRVGGRLKNATIPFNYKHPIILPSKGHYTKLIIKQEHERQLHAGPYATLAAVRRNYWPIGGRAITRMVIHECLRCFRVNPKTSNQLMGDLPIQRLEHPLRPFNNCGIDYAGPINLKDGFTRSRKTIKAYIALFICLTTKAVHLELVTGLTTEAFINALRRFISRRGNISKIYSDNATNFVGAERELKKAALHAAKQIDQSVVGELTKLNIEWHFIPPRTPHFGGLWEAGIKSVKNHIKRTIGETVLNYEEMYTFLTRIEACLNSRPITPLSPYPDDLDPLTPGHFLTGDALTAPVEPELQHLPVERLTRWQHVESMRQHFWRRWSREYLHTLQQRSKWKENQENLKLNTLVLMKEENTPTLQWRLGRITELHPGSDGLVRVVSLKTKGGIFKRGINKICALPLQ